jgi:hypothetical protein
MKQIFRPKRFKGDADYVVTEAVRVSDEYLEKGYTVTLRQLYYQMVAQDLFPDSWIDVSYNKENDLPVDTKNTMKNYKRFGALVSDARMAGLIDWDAVEDRLRATVSNTHWRTHEEILRAAIDSWRMDKWQNQNKRIEVFCEKDAVAGILEPVCRMHDVPFTACRGYASASLFYRKGQEFRDSVLRGKPVGILYFGDHDPSGLDMDRDVLDRIREFSRLEKYSDLIFLVRLGLTMEQIEEMEPPPNPAKSTDSRYKGYREKFGDESWELDALSPEDLESILESALLEIRDEDAWDKAVERENKMRVALAKRVGLSLEG